MSTKKPRKCTPAGSNPPLEQLNKRLLQGQIRPFGDKRQYPLLMRFQWRYASSSRFRRCASAFVPALQPSDSRTDTDPKAFGRLAPRCPLNLHRLDHAFPQVTRIGLRHCIPPQRESMTKDSLNPSPLGIPPIQIGREPLLACSSHPALVNRRAGCSPQSVCAERRPACRWFMSR